MIKLTQFSAYMQSSWKEIIQKMDYDISQLFFKQGPYSKLCTHRFLISDKQILKCISILVNY